jgi:WD40 repeat protein
VRVWWNARGRGTQLAVFQGHFGGVNAVAFTPDGARVLSGSADQTVRVWDARKGEQLMTLPMYHDDIVWALVCSPDGSRIVLGLWDCAVRVRRTDGGAAQGHKHWVGSVAFSPDGRRIASASMDGTV